MTSILTQGDDTGESTGIVIDIVKTTMEALDKETVFSYAPPARVVSMLRNKSIDAGVVVLINPGVVLESLVCSQPLVTVPFGLYLEASSPHRSPNIPWDQLKIGAQSLSHADWPPEFEKLNIQFFKNPVLIFRSLKAKRVNSIVSSALIVEHLSEVFQIKMEAREHVGYMSAVLCFSVEGFGEAAELLADQFTKSYFDIVDNQSERLSPTTLRAIKLFDSRGPPGP
ncbi:hypothetical protein HBA55_35820 [Pseudomaricurvus alkylphenolicus]|uniref:hypothetical protein n=1 Tax=Pseudomaricurvus alkylphenolicus TaxID=1306991 RepID=UPI001421F3FA|nr:hypothetical protein [Pseudomaricurvus alkylphenolicus]NIB45003.1 hypothetical protein [Pseudomaricurvus alkylphenolicus]